MRTILSVALELSHALEPQNPVSACEIVALGDWDIISGSACSVPNALLAFVSETLAFE